MGSSALFQNSLRPTRPVEDSKQVPLLRPLLNLEPFLCPQLPWLEKMQRDTKGKIDWPAFAEEAFEPARLPRRLLEQDLDETYVVIVLRAQISNYNKATHVYLWHDLLHALETFINFGVKRGYLKEGDIKARLVPIQAGKPTRRYVNDLGFAVDVRNMNMFRSILPQQAASLLYENVDNGATCYEIMKSLDGDLLVIQDLLMRQILWHGLKRYQIYHCCLISGGVFLELVQATDLERALQRKEYGNVGILANLIHEK